MQRSGPAVTNSPRPLRGRALLDQLSALDDAPGRTRREARHFRLGRARVHGFPKAHHQQIHSTNPLERLNADIKQRTDVVGIFPNEAAITRLVGALLLVSVLTFLPPIQSLLAGWRVPSTESKTMP